jgi:hypothetical protein
MTRPSPQTLSRWAEEISGKIKDFTNSHHPVRWHGECRFYNGYIYIQLVLQPHPSRRRNTEGVVSLFTESRSTLIDAVAKVNVREVDLVCEMTTWLEETVRKYGFQPVSMGRMEYDLYPIPLWRECGSLGEIGAYLYYLEYH